MLRRATMAITGQLVTGRIDFNDVNVVRKTLEVLHAVARQPDHYRKIRVKNNIYFEIPEGLPSVTGWYVFLAGKVPVYVGQATNLNNRLNSDNGSRDNFANPKRKHDIERNFIKKLHILGVHVPLGVWFVTEAELRKGLGEGKQLSSLDLNNVEKFIKLNRGFLTFS